MMSFAVLLLCAVSGNTLGSTLKPAQEANSEDAVSKQTSNLEEKLLLLVRGETAAVKEEILEVLTRKLEQVSRTMSDMGKILERATEDMTEGLQIQKRDLLLTHDPLWSEVYELKERDIEMFKKIENVENEVSLLRANLLQVQLNETANMTHSCTASQTEMIETIQKNIETLEANLSSRIGNVAVSLETLRKSLDDEKVTVQNNANDIGQLKQEVSRIQTLCSPPCENGGQCVKNVCNCPTLFTGDRCQQVVCSPPCENGGECMKENICNCTPLFAGDRCQDVMCSPPCENGGQCLKSNACQCTPNFAGDRCQQAVCNPPCRNGGRCMKNNVCNCTPFFTGYRCQEVMCSPRCENGGQCLKNNACQCTRNFAGDRCQQAVCNPPCRNGGRCMNNNVCNCTPFFTGYRCQEVACSPPCANGGQCMRNNICKCGSSFYGYRCEAGPKCGVDFDNGENNGGRNTSSVLVWPWNAAVYQNKTSKTELLCFGSVIHRHFVLAPARSFYAQYTSYEVSVKLGLSDLKKSTHLQEFQVRSIHKHPQFRAYSNYDYDIALLELKKPIKFDPFVRPVCLPSREIPQDETFYKPQSSAKAVFLEPYIRSPQTASPTTVNLAVLPQEACRRKIKELDWENLFPPSPDHTFCTESSTTTLPDWGSPMTQSRLSRDGTRTWTQVGIQMWNKDHKYYFSPRLDHLMAWVEETISASSKR